MSIVETVSVAETVSIVETVNDGETVNIAGAVSAPEFVRAAAVLATSTGEDCRVDIRSGRHRLAADEPESVVTAGHQAAGTGHHAPVTRHRAPRTAHQPSATGHRPPRSGNAAVLPSRNDPTAALRQRGPVRRTSRTE